LFDLEDISIAIIAVGRFKNKSIGARVPNDHELLLVAAHINLTQIVQVLIIGERTKLVVCLKGHE